MNRLKTVLFIALLLCLVFQIQSQDRSFLRASVSDTSYVNRVLIESSSVIQASVEKEGDRLLVRFQSNRSVNLQRREFTSQFVKSLEWTAGRDSSLLTVELYSPRFSYDTFSRDNPPQYYINIRPEEEISQAEDPTDRSGRTPQSGSAPLLAQGQRTIVIDPGHGGVENGAEGTNGALEKDVTLEISLRLKDIIERNLAFNVILTRDKDVEISLEERAALANYNNAFLFISIHANGSPRKNARGPETYFLSLNATDQEARRLAYLENNQPEMAENSTSSEEDEIQMILWDMAQSAFLEQSSRLAVAIQNELNLLLKTRNRGVKQAPFRVLSGVACPAVLVEVAFLSNQTEEKMLTSEEFQDQVSQVIFKGLIAYIRDSASD
ncbi:N-acetylmuramoyl-L-alanine amidase [Acidobacteriota bacterium]